MLQFKLLLIGYLCLQVVWTASVETDSFSSNELENSKPLSNEEAIPKANWPPICQQVQVNELWSNLVAPESNIVYIPEDTPDVVISPVRTTESSADVCEAPNGLGLKNLLKQSKELLPHDRLKSIINAAAQDSEVKRVKELLTSENFRSKVRNFVESPHFIILRDYVCRALNLDVKYYVQFVRNLIAVEKLKEPANGTTNWQGRAGIRGLIQDLYEALPKQKLRDLYVRLLIADEHLVVAVRRLKSVEFRQLLKNIKKQKEFDELKQILLEANLPLQSIKELVDTALGWQSDELTNQEFEKI